VLLAAWSTVMHDTQLYRLECGIEQPNGNRNRPVRKFANIEMVAWSHHFFVKYSKTAQALLSPNVAGPLLLEFPKHIRSSTNVDWTEGSSDSPQARAIAKS